MDELMQEIIKLMTSSEVTIPKLKYEQVEKLMQYTNFHMYQDVGVVSKALKILESSGLLHNAEITACIRYAISQKNLSFIKFFEKNAEQKDSILSDQVLDDLLNLDKYNLEVVNIIFTRLNTCFHFIDWEDKIKVMKKYYAISDKTKVKYNKEVEGIPFDVRLTPCPATARLLRHIRRVFPETAEIVVRKWKTFGWSDPYLIDDPIYYVSAEIQYTSVNLRDDEPDEIVIRKKDLGVLGEPYDYHKLGDYSGCEDLGIWVDIKTREEK